MAYLRRRRTKEDRDQFDARALWREAVRKPPKRAAPAGEDRANDHALREEPIKKTGNLDD